MNDQHMMKTTYYLTELIPARSEWAQTLERYAQDEKIPIIDPLSMHVIQQLLLIHQPTQILEIGTAIGYSALRMHEVIPDATILTIEKNNRMYDLANEHIKKYATNENISIIQGDALDVIENLPTDYAFDFVFIDAAKSQYERFFTAVEPHITEGCMIVADNVLFRGYVVEQT